MDSGGGSRVAPVAGAVLGAAFFAWIAGVHVLDPRSVGWTMQLDWRVHFLGWHLFRGEPWHWPPGLLESYARAPAGTAIGYTDSIPLAAFALKPLAPWLPMPFHYLGVWMLGCFAIQGYLGALLARVWTRDAGLQVLVALLFVLMPTLLMRVGHPALCAHWLVLWALWLYLRGDRAAALRQQAAIGLAAGLVHPYLALMVLAVLAARAVRIAIAGGPPGEATRYRHAAAGFGVALLATVTGWWASGLFTVPAGSSLASEGLGKYSMNLLAPITPTGWSRFLPEWPLATAGQAYEGFQYLGAGSLALLLVAAGLAWRTRRPLPWRAMAPVVAAAAACGVYALSPRVTLGGAVLFDYGGQWLEPFAVFRATGRFFWPLGYLAIASAAALVVTRLPRAAAAAVLGGAVLLQAVDLHGAHVERHRTSRDPAFLAWSPPFASPFWDRTLPAYDHLVLVEPPECGPGPIGFEAAAYLAGLHGMTINAGEVARFDPAARAAYCDTLRADVAAGRLDDRTVYLAGDESAAAIMANPATRVTCERVDGVTACVTGR
ncbi:MAG: DUF6311 domain-containing protein [Vicinamibacterales bacterium]